jgi:hypothetical protein
VSADGLKFTGILSVYWLPEVSAQTIKVICCPGTPLVKVELGAFPLSTIFWTLPRERSNVGEVENGIMLSESREIATELVDKAVPDLTTSL